MTRKQEHNAAAELLEHLIPQWSAMVDKLNRVRDELVSLNGVTRRGASPRPIINGASLKLAVSAGQLAGFSITETSGVSTARVRLRDGLDTGGDVLMTVALSPGESARDWFLPHGIAYVTGLYVEVVSGAIEGTVYVGPFGA